MPGSGPNGSWIWNGVAPYEPFGVIPVTPQSPFTIGDPLIPGSYLMEVSGDLWNLSTPQSGGTLPSTVSSAVTMTYNGTLSVSAGFNVAPSFNWFAKVVGYPSLTYGYSPQANTITPENASLALPLQLSALPNLWSMVNYSATSLPLSPVNLAYDIFITPGCQTHSLHPALELMIWPFSRLDAPIGFVGGNLGKYTTQSWVNGSLVSTTWTVYAGSSGNGTTTVSFILNPSELPLQSGASSQYLGVNISAIVEDMIEALAKPSTSKALGTTWTQSELEGYYMNNISFGGEFGALSNFGSTTTNHDYSYSVSDFCFVIAAPNTSPAPGSWSSYACPFVP